MILPAGPGFPASYDAAATAGGIPVGTSATGFAVRGTWLGAGVPGPLPYEILDPLTFATLDHGLARPAANGAVIPTLGDMALLALLLALGLIGAGRLGLRWPTLARRWAAGAAMADPGAALGGPLAACRT